MGKADEEIQKAIAAGQFVVEIQLDGKEEIGRTEYNRPKHIKLTDYQVERFARAILPSIEAFYSREENRKAFEDWQKEQNNKPYK